jgi:hypothetical protein
MFTAFDPTNFLQTDTYGISPANTTLTVRYLVGGGVSSNVDSNTLNALINANNASFIQNNLNQTTANYIFGTIALNNQTAASGGSDGDTLEEIRQNSLVTFQSQLRNVTQADYLVRTLSMPSNYGSIAKAYAEPVKIENLLPGETPSVLDIYVLGYNADSNLTTVSDTVKSNLQTYLYEYRMINDSIRIRDGFVINIGVNFDIIVLPNFNSNEVLINCVNALKTYFNIENWSINQPIILKDLYIELSKVQGVQTIKDIQVINKSGIINGYSQYAYDIIGANQNGTIYPSLDPSIFEIKYPDSDIQGRVVSF